MSCKDISAITLCGMAILMFGVARKSETGFVSSMLTLGALLLATVLVISGTAGNGYEGQFVVE